MRRPITPDHDRQITGQPHLSVDDAEVFVTTQAIEDAETQRDLVSDQISVRVLPYWGGRPGRTLTVEGLVLAAEVARLCIGHTLSAWIRPSPPRPGGPR